MEWGPGCYQCCGRRVVLWYQGIRLSQERLQSSSMCTGTAAVCGCGPLPCCFLHHAILLDIRVWLLMLTWIWLLVGRYCYVAATAAAGKACGKELGHRGMLLECNAKCHVQVLLDTFGCLLVH